MNKLIAPVAALLTLLLFAPSSHGGQSDPGCPESMRCLRVGVPLDRGGEHPGTISLPVAVEPGDGPLFLFLGGGPGQGMVAHAEAVAGAVRDLAPGYRTAVLDQRGTGATALRCPSLQHLSLSDLTVPPPRAVRRCGESLGAARAFYGTTDTVEDLEAVRIALGVDQLTIMGVSYGTYVAERYATAHPDRVRRLILDSVVPQRGIDPFFRANMRRAGVVLRRACRSSRCETVSGDPAADLNRLVRSKPFAGKVPGKRHKLKVDGPAIFDWLTSISSFSPEDLPRFQRAVTGALRGDRGPILRVGDRASRLSSVTPAASLSMGLHSATLCADTTLPFPIRSPFANRRAALKRAVSRIGSREVFPFDRRTVRGNGGLATCLNWPATVVSPPPKPRDLLPIPVLLFAGAYDLSTPPSEARLELARAPRGRLIMLGGGHGTAISDTCGRRAIARFIAARLGTGPCGTSARP